MSKRLALVIGNSLYRDDNLARLVSPDADVGALKDTLLDPDLGGFDDVKLVFNSASHIVRREISHFFSQKARMDMLLLYFSGHGVLDDRGRLYLAVKDTDTNLLRGTAIPANYITDEMDNSRSQRQVLVLDCCHSGAFARGTKGSTGNSVGTAKNFEGSGFGRVILTASDATQYAWEGNQIIGKAENSLFTHFIIQGIRTGEADLNGNGNISVDEIYDYAYEQTLKKTPKQTPGKWSFREQGELIIAKSPSSDTQHYSSPNPGYANEEEQKRQKNIYMDGLSAFWLEDWDKAIKKFEVFLEKDPDNQEIQQKLVEATQHKKNDLLYDRAIQKMDEGNLAESMNLFETLIADAPDYKDATQRLEKVRVDKTLIDLYQEAEQLFKSGKFHAVVRIMTNIHELSPNYEDPNGLLEKGKIEVKKIQHKQMLEDLYNRGVLELDAGNLNSGKTIFQQIEKIEKGYKDTGKFIKRIDSLLLKESDRLRIEVGSDKKKILVELKPFLQRLANPPNWLITVAKVFIVMLLAYGGYLLWSM